MTKKYIRLANLIYQEKIGTLSESEKRELLEWLNESESHKQIYEQIFVNFSFQKRCQELQELEENRIWRKIECQINPKPLGIWKKIGYAASILVLFAWSYFLYVNLVEQENWPEFTHVVPGMQNAVLRLATGECLELGTENKIIQEGATGKIEQIKGMLVYQMQDSVQEEQYNTLEVPNSGEFQLVLSDGTQVWLNAGTKLTYPIAFVKGERKVYIEGEAYFEVAKNEKKPFIVHANGMDIRVLGTSFNLKSFVEDKQSVVTLLSGRVEVKTSSKRVVLQPEQQAEFRVDKNQLIVQKADLKSVLAWKNDMFIFKDASLEYMMKELGRWFDVEVEFESEELKALRVYIYIERSKTLKDVLDKITSIDGLKWRIEKKKIILESDKN